VGQSECVRASIFTLWATTVPCIFRRVLKRSLAIFEKAPGPDHLDVAKSLEYYAALLRKTNREAEAEAEKLEARARTIRAEEDSKTAPK
jgi:hypothetical protein